MTDYVPFSRGKPPSPSRAVRPVSPTTPGSRGSGRVRGFLLRRRSLLCRRGDMRYDGPSRKPCRKGASWPLPCSRSDRWPPCLWCWGFYASSTWQPASIRAALHPLPLSSRVGVVWRRGSSRFWMALMPSLRSGHAWRSVGYSPCASPASREPHSMLTGWGAAPRGPVCRAADARVGGARAQRSGGLCPRDAGAASGPHAAGALWGL
jgi:hypothetical protein